VSSLRSIACLWVLFFLPSLAWAQNQLDQNSQEFIWLLRNNIVKATSIEDRRAHISRSAEIYSNSKDSTLTSQQRQALDSFNLAFYLDRDLGLAPQSTYTGSLSITERRVLRDELLNYFNSYKAFRANPNSDVATQANASIANLWKVGISQAVLVKPNPTPAAPVNPAPAPPRQTPVQSSTSSSGEVITGNVSCGQLNLHASELACMRNNARFQNHNIVIDPGHFGGRGIQDSRELPNGFREGEGAFISSLILRKYLSECMGKKYESLPMTRYNLSSLGQGPQRRNVQRDSNDEMFYRREYIASLNPDLLISVHTNGLAGQSQRAEVIQPSEAILRRDVNRFAVGLSQQEKNNIVQNTRTLSQPLAQSFQRGLDRGYDRGTRAQEMGLTRDPRFGNSYTKLHTNTPGNADDGNPISHYVWGSAGHARYAYPMLTTEGFFHDYRELTDKLVKQRSEKIQYRTQEFGTQNFEYHPAFQWYAEGLVYGLVDYYGCGATGSEARGSH
jgi:N-acetylmuramoyl-L-alanine amidase